MRMKDSLKQRKISRLAERDGAGKEAGRQSEGYRHAPQVISPFRRHDGVPPRRACDDHQIRRPCWHSNDLVGVRQVARADPYKKPVQSTWEKCCHEQVDVVPEPGRRDADEIPPAAATASQPDGRDIHPGLEEMQPSDIILEVRRQPEHEDEHTAARRD